MKRAVAIVVLLVLCSVGLISCYSSSYLKKPPSGLFTRVLVSQSVTTPFTPGSLIIINGPPNDIVARASQISAGASPGLMAISPNRATVLAFDASSNSVQVVNTTTESNVGAIHLPGPTQSMAIENTSIAFAAVPTAALTGYAAGAIEVLNLSSGSSSTIGVPAAQTVIENSNGTQLLVFSTDSNSVSVISPLAAEPPLDAGCNNPVPNPVCSVVSGFDRPVYGIYGADGSSVYILNCGAECGGVQASVSILDLATLTITATIPVNGATIGLVSGSTLYVAGKGTATGPLCTSIPSAAATAATYCGTLDPVNLSSLQDPAFNNPAAEIAIPDGYHDRMDITYNGQLFVGSHKCTNIGNVNNPSGEVRGCLAIYNTTNNAVVIPPDSGDVTGLQSFTSQPEEYVVEGSFVRVYNTLSDALQTTNSTNGNSVAGTIDITGQMTDVKAIDFF